MNIKIYSWSQKTDLFFFCKFLKNYFNKIVDSWSASHIRKAPLMGFSLKHFHGNLNVKMCIFHVPLFYCLATHVHRSIVHVNYVLFWYEQLWFLWTFQKCTVLCVPRPYFIYTYLMHSTVVRTYKNPFNMDVSHESVKTFLTWCTLL